MNASHWKVHDGASSFRQLTCQRLGDLDLDLDSPKSSDHGDWGAWADELTRLDADFDDDAVERSSDHGVALGSSRFPKLSVEARQSRLGCLCGGLQLLEIMGWSRAGPNKSCCNVLVSLELRDPLTHLGNSGRLGLDPVPERVRVEGGDGVSSTEGIAELDWPSDEPSTLRKGEDSACLCARDPVKGSRARVGGGLDLGGDDAARTKRRGRLRGGRIVGEDNEREREHSKPSAE